MATEMNRRAFVNKTLLSSAGLVLAGEARDLAAASAAIAPAQPQATLPKAKLGKLEVSRLILGGNLLTHYTHSRDLQYVYNLAAHYNTDEKIMETLALAEQHGINALSMHNPDHPMSVLRRYRQERGGKIQWIICPTAQIDPDLAVYRQDIEALLKDGCEALYVWGVHTDAMVPQGKVNLIAKAVDLMKSYGVPAGVGAHALESIKTCEQYGVKADFYIKTFHHHQYPSGPKPEQIKGPYNENPGYWCANPEGTAEFMKKVEKPWIAFKVMAAGAIPPKDAIPYAYNHGADCVLAGMFDFEIAEDAQIARTAIAGAKDRVRPWKG
jgi:hypothetical protein